MKIALYILLLKVGKIFAENKRLDPGLYIVSYRLRRLKIIIIIIIIIIQYVCLPSQAFLPDTFLEPAVIPTAQASSFTLQYLPYYV